MPERLKMKNQLQHTAGQGVRVTRPYKYGNPFKVNEHRTAQEAVDLHREWVMSKPGMVDSIKRDLKGKNLFCFCDLDQPCHADTLLQIANED